MAREDGNLTLADALDITRFEAYEGYLDEELHQRSEPSRLSTISDQLPP
jgi:hypothetical protein